MDSTAFVAGLNTLIAEMDALPPAIAQILANLLELVDAQHGNILTLLETNRKLLGVIDELKR